MNKKENLEISIGLLSNMNISWKGVVHKLNIKRAIINEGSMTNFISPYLEDIIILAISYLDNEVYKLML